MDPAASRVLRLASALLLAGSALAGAGLLTLASTGVLRTAAPAWTVEATLAGRRVPLSVAGLLRLATLPGAAWLLDGRRVVTRLGELRLAREDRRLVAHCSPCTLPPLESGDMPAAVLDRAAVAVARDGDELRGELRTGNVVLSFVALIEAERVTVRWTLPRTPMAGIVGAMARTVPEARFARIEGTLAAHGRLVLPQRNGAVAFDLRDFDVGGLGTEVLQYGWFRLACADAAGRPRTLVSGDGERDWLPLDRLGAYLPVAVIAAEDQRFLEHDGIDRVEIAIALAGGAPTRGASTLTQQLARTLFTGGERSAARKLRELLYAAEMERTLGKARILELYLNAVYWGPGMCGARGAARGYFGKTPAQLSPLEAAWLAGILRNPQAAHDRQFLPRIADRERATGILMQMREFPARDRRRWAKERLEFRVPPKRSGT